MHQLAVFRICVRGKLDESWSEYFDVRSISVDEDRTGQATTVMESKPIDQAALVGLINHLNALGIPLIALECVT